MVDFLEQPGAENVTEKFDMIIRFGLISNMIYLLFNIFKMGLTRRGKHSIDSALICSEMCIGAVWITQFLMVISFRFSQTGYVCSGDYAED